MKTVNHFTFTHWTINSELFVLVLHHCHKFTKSIILQAPSSIHSIQFSSINPKSLWTFISMPLYTVNFFLDDLDRNSWISDFQFTIFHRWNGGSKPGAARHGIPTKQPWTNEREIYDYVSNCDISGNCTDLSPVLIYCTFFSFMCDVEWMLCVCYLVLSLFRFLCSCSALHLFPILSNFLPSSSFYAKYDIQQHNFSAFDILPRSVFSFMYCMYYIWYGIASALFTYNRYTVYCNIVVWLPAIHSFRFVPFIQPAWLTAVPSEQRDEHKIKTEKLLYG